ETDQTIQARAESVFTKLAVRAEPEEKPFKTLVLETFDILQERARQVNVSGVLFNIPSLDRILCGLHPGELWVIAAQTSGGKSCLAMQAAVHSALHRGIASAIFSLEMNAHELIERMLAHAGNVNMRAIRTGDFNQQE